MGSPTVDVRAASAHFKWVLIIVTVLTTVFVAAAIGVPYLPAPSGGSNTGAADSLWTFAKLGFGAIVGLLGGKAV